MSESKSPRRRFTVRRLMLVVFVVAVAIEAEIIWRNRAFYQERVLHHARMAQDERTRSKMAAARVPHPTNESETGMFRYVARTRAERAEWHETLRIKWARGVSHPWERVAPDPPTPESYGPIDYASPIYPTPDPSFVPAPAKDRE